MKIIQYVTCLNCRYSKAICFIDHRYAGLRGSCFVCGGNWPES